MQIRRIEIRDFRKLSHVVVEDLQEQAVARIQLVAPLVQMLADVVHVRVHFDQVCRLFGLRKGDFVLCNGRRGSKVRCAVGPVACTGQLRAPGGTEDACQQEQGE